MTVANAASDTLTWPEIAALIAIIMAVGAVAGWVWRLQDKINAAEKSAIQRADEVNRRLHDFQVMVARDYVAKGELQEMRREILDAFRRLEDRLEKRLNAD